MEALEAIKKRRSIRKYKEIPVEWDKIVNMLEAAKYAPCAGNLYETRIIVVTDKAKREALAEACLKQYWMVDAPVHIVLMARPEKTRMHYGDRGTKLYSIQNVAAAAENMMIMATDQGLATCWVGAFDEDMVKKVCKIPEKSKASDNTYFRIL